MHMFNFKCNTPLGGLDAPSPIPWQVHAHLGQAGCGGTILDSKVHITLYVPKVQIYGSIFPL